jgi:hypothetical protein
MAGVMGPWLFFKGFRVWRTRRLISDTPTARIRSMAMGLVEIKGSVTPRSSAVAPFTGRPCAYWEVDIATQARNSYTIIHRNQSGQPFYVRDESGVALVYPKGAEAKLNFAREELCRGIMLPDCYSEYLREHGTLATTMGRMSMLRFRERIIEEGQEIYVLGTATPRARAHVISDGEALESLATGTDDAFRRPMRTLDEEVAAVVRKGQNESTFVLSQDPEEHVTTMLGLRSWGMLVGGPLLTLIGLGHWLTKLYSG